MISQSLVGYNPQGRPEADYYPTPERATLALLRHITIQDRTVWEPACGNGDISRILEKHGSYVISSDLHDYGFGRSGVNFLEVFQKESDTIITNPPFMLANQFLAQGLNLGVKRIYFLLKLAFLEGNKRSKLLEASPLSRVMVFRKRLTMTRNGLPMKNGGMIPFAWFEWQEGYHGSPTIIWI